MNRTQLYLPKTQLDRLRKVAKQEKTTVSAVVRYFVSQQLGEINDTNNKIKQPVPLAVIAKKINLLGIKAPQNLSKKIDAYLYGNG